MGESKRGLLFDGSNPLLGIAALIEDQASRSLLENGINASFSIQKDRIGKFDLVHVGSATCTRFSSHVCRYVS